MHSRALSRAWWWRYVKGVMVEVEEEEVLVLQIEGVGGFGFLEGKS